MKARVKEKVRAKARAKERAKRTCAAIFNVAKRKQSKIVQQIVVVVAAMEFVKQRLPVTRMRIAVVAIV